MESRLTEVCDEIANINSKNKLEIYTRASGMFNDCLSQTSPFNFPLTANDVTNIQSDLQSREEGIKTAASHLFLTLVQLSVTLTTVLVHTPDSWTYPIQNFLSDTKSLVLMCFPLLGSGYQASQRESLSVVRSRTEQIRAWGIPANQEAQTILTNLVETRILPRLEEMLGEPELQEVLAMEIWQQLIYSIGNYIPTTNHELINRLLKLIEFCFKSNRSEVQSCAYMSWSILIKTFSLHPTFLVKKLRLFNVPLLSCAVKQDHRYTPVDVERAKTWCQLIVSLAPELEDHSTNVLTPFFYFCIGMDPKLTPTDKFNETFTTHFSSVFTSGELDVHQTTDFPGVVPATQDDVTTVRYTLDWIESNGDFLSFLSRLANKQHLPKKAMSDTDTLNVWRQQLAFQGLQALAAFLIIDFPDTHAHHTSTKPELYHQLKKQLTQPVGTSHSYIQARNTWIIANHRILFVLLGLCIQLSEPIHGEMIAKCFRRILHIVTSSPEMIDRKQLLYPSLALSHIAVVKKHFTATIVNLITSIQDCIPEQLCFPLSVSGNEGTIGARFFIDILLVSHLLKAEEPLSDAYFELYQHLLYSRNIKGRSLSDYKQYLVCFDVCCHDVTNTWRGWKISAEALLELIQATNQVNEGTYDCPDFSSCQYVLSFPITQFTSAPSSSTLIRESADVWKSISSCVLKLISEQCPEENNKFVESISENIVSLPTSQLDTPSRLYFITLFLDNLIDLITFQHSFVFPQASPLSPTSDASNSLGSITHSINALSKLMLLSFTSELSQSHSPRHDTNTIESVTIEEVANSQAVTNVLMIAIQMFSLLDNSLIIQNVLICLSHPIGLYFTLAYSPQTNGVSSPRDADTFYCLVARLWDVIKTSVLTHFHDSNSFNTNFLQILSPILLPLFEASDQSILTSVCDFFSRTFAVSTDAIEYPETLHSILTSLQNRGVIQLPVECQISSPPLNDTTTSRKSQAVRKLECRENPTDSASKRAKLSDHDSYPISSPTNKTSNSEQPQIVFVSSNDTTVDTTDMTVIPKGCALPTSAEENPFPVAESGMSLSDIRNTDFPMDITDTPTRPMVMTPDLTGNNDTAKFTKPPFKFYSESKQNNKPHKSQKSLELKPIGSPLQAPMNDKEKRPFFTLQLTPLKLDEIKSSPTHHHSVNRRLQFSEDDELSTIGQLGEAETLPTSPPLNPTDVSVLDLEPNDTDASSVSKPDHDLVAQLNVDSIEEFLEGIPLDAIISPDEDNETSFQAIPTPDDATVSQDTNSLTSLTSTSISQSITPPQSDPEPRTSIQEPHDSIPEVDEVINTRSEETTTSATDQPIAVNLCPMEIPNEPEGVERDVHNDSLDEQALNTSALINKITTPESNTVTSTTHPFTTPTHSILKKQSIYSPSPNIKKVSFADPLEERHSIIISPKIRKLRSQKHSPANKLSANNSNNSFLKPNKTSSNDPIFPMLLECREPVDVLIPALTSQTISRGIVGLLKSKHIETIGDLAMLSEGVAETLPIQPPKLQTLRMAFTKYQATQLGNSLEIIRQSSNPLQFPQNQELETGEDEGWKEKEDTTSTEVVELQDVELISEIMSESPIPLTVDTPSYNTSSTQTDSVPLLTQLNEFTSAIGGQLSTLSQQELLQMHNSLCHVLPSIADNFQTTT